MKIAIFENEYSSIKGAFDSANLINFNGTLVLQNYSSSQSADLNIIVSYDVIFVDIDLSTKSLLDGFGLIQKLIGIKNDISKKIVILTGNNNIKENLNDRGIESGKISVIIKPVSFVEISQVINKVKKNCGY